MFFSYKTITCHKKGVKVLESIQRKAAKEVEGLEGGPVRRLRTRGLPSVAQSRPRGGLPALCSS